MPQREKKDWRDLTWLKSVKQMEHRESCANAVLEMEMTPKKVGKRPEAERPESDRVQGFDDDSTDTDDPYNSSGSEYQPSCSGSDSDQEEKTKDFIGGDETDFVADSESECESILFPMLRAQELKSRKEPISVAKRLTKNRWDKMHYCKFCSEPKIKMSTHLQRVHKHEVEVAAVMALAKGSKERREGFIHLLHEGDYSHNIEVLKSGSGCLVPKYRTETRTSEECLACPHCKGLYKKTLLSKHIPRCARNPGGGYKKGQSAKMGRLMLPVSYSSSAAFKLRVLGKMGDDPIGKLVRSDSLILMYGEMIFEKRDIEEHTTGQIVGRMRGLAMLLKVLRQRSDMTVSSMTAALDPANFDLLISCVRERAGFSDSTHKFKTGNVALKTGYALKKCCHMLSAEAIKVKDDDLKDKAERFKLLFEGDWYDRVSAAASESVGRAKMNKPHLLPAVSDVEKVTMLLEADSKSESYATLAKATLASITIFNRKRGGEVQRMKAVDVQLKPKMNRADAKMLEGLSHSEKKLAEVFQRVEIRGKFNRPVPILLMTESIQKLADMRNTLKIDSPYLFATPSGENPYRGSDIIRDYANEAGVSDDSLFTATNLRKQLATLSQAMEIQKMDQDQLATFLGHDIRIFRNVYRLPLPLMQKTRVASVLLKVNRGVELPTEIPDESLQKEEIELGDTEEGPIEGETIPEDVTQADDGTASPVAGRSCDDVQQTGHASTHCLAGSVSESDSEGPTNECVSGCKNRKRLGREDTRDCGGTKGNSSVGCYSSSRRRPQKAKRPWTVEETSAVNRQLKDCLILNRCPGKHEAELAIAKESSLSGRSWKDVKYYVYNQLKKKRPTVQ